MYQAAASGSTYQAIQVSPNTERTETRKIKGRSRDIVTLLVC